MSERTKFWLIRSWWGAVIAAIVPVVNYITGAHMDSGEILAIVLAILALVFREGMTGAKLTGLRR